MNARVHGVSQINNAIAATRLHDGTAILALGIGLLRSGEPWSKGDPARPLDLFDQALVSLKQLERELRQNEPAARQSDLGTALKHQAELLGIELEPQITDSEADIAPGQIELLRLAGREALLNVRRHSGARVCRIAIDLASCPFTFRARDWGAGLRTGANPGHGLELLRQFAEWLGCQLVVASQPGIGTELAVYGPRYPSSETSPAEQRAARRGGVSS